MLAIITPSRARPERVCEMLRAIEDTATGPWRLWLGIDDDEPRRGFYHDLFCGRENVTTIRGPRMTLSTWTNRLARLATADGAQWLASLGDDHQPRTIGWDEKLTEAAGQHGPGWAYGNDLLRPDLPTAWVQSAKLATALGWMMLPTCEHLYVDNVILDLGRTAGRIEYLPDVVIEHMHPAAGKAIEDASYKASNSGTRICEDRRAYEAWVQGGLATDADLVRNLK